MEEFGFGIFQPMAFINDEEVPGGEGGREGRKAEGGVVPKEDFICSEDDEGGGKGERRGGGEGGRGITNLSSSSSFPTTSPAKALLHHSVEGRLPRFLLPSMRVHFDRRRELPQFVFPTTQH